MALNAPPIIAIAEPVSKNDFVLITSAATVASGATGTMYFSVGGLDTVGTPFIDVDSYPWSALTSGAYTQLASGTVLPINAYVASANTMAINFYNNGTSGAPLLGYYRYIIW